MFGGRNDGLPMAQYNSYGGSGDGSGKSIKMDAPIVKAWKKSSGYTKATYYCLVANILIAFLGYRALRHSNASVWLTCHAQYCDLKITPPGRLGTIKVEFSRQQIVKSVAIKIDKQGNFVKLDNSPTIPMYSGKRKGKYKSNSKGPDREGLYDSYTLVLRDGAPESSSNEYEASLDTIKQFTHPEEGGNNENLVLSMRRFNFGQTRRRTKTMVSKVDAYLKHRRHQLTIKENSPLSWQGIVGLVLGLFGFLLTCLIGQFWDEPNQVGGPGARRRRQTQPAPRRRQPRPSRTDPAGLKKGY